MRTWLLVAVASTMVRIPSGSYRPLHTTPGGERAHVAAFRIDRDPVTRRAFERFVVSHPSWRRGTVRSPTADAGYLQEWSSPTQAGVGADLGRPVTSVSWFAAAAYCASVGKRLPTLDEWEYVAAADASRRDASADPVFRDRILELTARRTATPPVAGRGVQNVYGVRDLHGVVWEWTSDFTPAHISGGKRTAHEHHLFCASSAIGATDPANYAAFARAAVRAALSARSTTRSLGFRCAADIPA